MNREQINFPPPQQKVRYIPNNQPSQQYYSDYGIPMNSDIKKSNQSLQIFNGQAGQREMYPAYDRPVSQTQGIKIAKSSSQKNLPIIYNTYNERGHQSQNLQNTLSPKQQITNINRQGFQYGLKINSQQFEENHSDVYQYRQDFAKKDEHYHTDANGIHTFKYLPPQSNPQTAQFIQLPSEHFNNDSRQNFYQQKPQTMHTHNPLQQRYTMNQIPPKSQSRVIIQGQIPVAPPSPQMKFQPFRQGVPSSDSTSKLIQIPQQQYQKFIDHLPRCKQSQDQIIRLRAKIEQVDQKQHFYWQQNMTLREQNKRLRDLVTHLQKRQKQLLKQKQQFKQECNLLVNRYRQSLLQQFGLLFERYRLEVQRNK